MSTKSTLTHGESFHLYQEMMEKSGVYLSLKGCDFEATPDGVTVRIPVDVWEHIRKSTGFTPRYHLMSDDELLDYVVKEVDERIRELAGAPENRRGLLALRGFLVYGDAGDPREKQIVEGLKYFVRERDHEQEIVSLIRLHEAGAV